MSQLQNPQVVLVSTRSSDSSLELCLDNDDDGARIDCCDTTESSSSADFSDQESTPQSPQRERETSTKSVTISKKKVGTPLRRKLFQQSSWKSTESFVETKKPEKQKRFRIGSPKTEQQEEQREEEVVQNTLFQDEMDIVAYQEWPPQRRQAYKQQLRIINGHFYRITYPVQKSPSSVCASLSIETVATKLGRSPVVVSFDDDNLVRDPSTLATPVPLAGRIQTGRFPRAPEGECKSQDADSECSAIEAKKPQSPIESFFKAIETTFRSMTCSKKI